MCDSLYPSIGTFHYSSDGCALKVLVDPELAAYYRALIPKWKNVKCPRWPAHITVVRQGKEIPTIMEPWGKYEGNTVEFFYSPVVHFGKVYYWLNVFCVRLEEIRRELGLPVRSEYTIPPEGFVKCFHMTLGNSKNVSINQK